jgi:hypothetical protein
MMLLPRTPLRPGSPEPDPAARANSLSGSGVAVNLTRPAGGCTTLRGGCWRYSPSSARPAGSELPAAPGCFVSHPWRAGAARAGVSGFPF